MAIIHSNGVPQKNPAKAAGLSLPNVESDLLQGALSIRLEVIGPTWRCIKQTRDVRVLLWGKAPAPDRLRPAEPTQHCRVHSWMGCASWRCCRASWSGRRARCGSRRVRARPRSNHGSIDARRALRSRVTLAERTVSRGARLAESHLVPPLGSQASGIQTRSPYVIAPGDVHAPQ